MSSHCHKTLLCSHSKNFKGFKGCPSVTKTILELCPSNNDLNELKFLLTANHSFICHRHECLRCHTHCHTPKTLLWLGRSYSFRYSGTHLKLQIIDNCKIKVNQASYHTTLIPYRGFMDFLKQKMWFSGVSVTLGQLYK